MKYRIVKIAPVILLAGIFATPAVLEAQTAGSGNNTNSSAVASGTNQNSTAAPAQRPDIEQSSEAVLQALGQLAQSTADEAEHYATKAYSGAKHEVTDSTVTTEVKAALLANQATTDSASSIHVDTRHDVVYLSGSVDSAATAASAQRIVAQLVGVKQVVNNLKYPPASGSPASKAESSANTPVAN